MLRVDRPREVRAPECRILADRDPVLWRVRAGQSPGAGSTGSYLRYRRFRNGVAGERHFRDIGARIRAGDGGVHAARLGPARRLTLELMRAIFATLTVAVTASAAAPAPVKNRAPLAENVFYRLPLTSVKP